MGQHPHSDPERTGAVSSTSLPPPQPAAAAAVRSLYTSSQTCPSGSLTYPVYAPSCSAAGSAVETAINGGPNPQAAAEA